MSNCPKCRNIMSESDLAGIETRFCESCKGLWVSARSLSILLRMERSQLSLDAIERLEHQTGKRLCYECPDTVMKVVKVGSVQLDRCARCRGTFFDLGEVVKVLPNHSESTRQGGTAQGLAIDGGAWVLFSWFSIL